MATRAVPASGLGSASRVAPGARRLGSRASVARAPRRAGLTTRAMFDRFDGDAVKAVKDGMDEAKKLRQTELKTEHLLIACAKVRDLSLIHI